MTETQVVEKAIDSQRPVIRVVERFEVTDSDGNTREFKTEAEAQAHIDILMIEPRVLEFLKGTEGKKKAEWQRVLMNWEEFRGGHV